MSFRLTVDPLELIDDPKKFLETDASMHDWGPVFGKNTTQGRWNLHEQSLYINILELRAIYLGIVSFCKCLVIHISVLGQIVLWLLII